MALFKSKPGAWFLILGILSLSSLLSSCTNKKQLSHEESCKERFDQLHAKFENGKYSEIRQPLTDLVSSCPGNTFTEQALFELAETQFHLGDWVEAQNEYSAFLKDFPNSTRFGELAQFRMAVANAKQVLIPQRDQTQTFGAIRAFENFLSSYPDSKYTDSASTQVEKLRTNLVTKELQIARLYLRMNEPQAAAIYYKGIIRDFPSIANLREVNLHLALCYVEMGQFEEAETYLAKFDGIAKDDPFQEEIKDAYDALNKAQTNYTKRKQKELERASEKENL